MSSAKPTRFCARCPPPIIRWRSSSVRRGRADLPCAASRRQRLPRRHIMLIRRGGPIMVGGRHGSGGMRLLTPRSSTPSPGAWAPGAPHDRPWRTAFLLRARRLNCLDYGRDGNHTFGVVDLQSVHGKFELLDGAFIAPHQIIFKLYHRKSPLRHSDTQYYALHTYLFSASRTICACSLRAIKRSGK